jgi:hypothetical protein
MQAELIETGFSKTSLRRAGVLLIAALAAAACAHKDKAPPTVPEAAKTPEAAAQKALPENVPHPVMDQRALGLLKRMSETLTSAKSYTYRSQGSGEIPASTGQFLTFFAENHIALERPNKLRAEITGDVPNFRIIYDGAKVWAYDPGKNLYAAAEAPASIDDTLKFLMDKAGIQFPAADLMTSDPYAAMSKDNISAFVVGPSLVDGHACDHLALIGPGVNWEIWIDSGREALPRRLAITYKEATNFPRYRVDFFDWKLNPTLPAGQFAFKPPKDAKQTEFESQVGQEFETPREGVEK